MSTKEIVQDTLQKLREDISLSDVARKIEFVAAVRQGMAELERGERISMEEIDEDDEWRTGAYNQFLRDDSNGELLEPCSVDFPKKPLLHSECEAKRILDSTQDLDRQNAKAPF